MHRVFAFNYKKCNWKKPLHWEEPEVTLCEDWQVDMAMHFSFWVRFVKLGEDGSLGQEDAAAQLDRLLVEVVWVLAAVVETFEELLLRNGLWGPKWKSVGRGCKQRVWEGDQPSAPPRFRIFVLGPVVDHNLWLLGRLHPQAFL